MFDVNFVVGKSRWNGKTASMTDDSSNSQKVKFSL